MPDTGYGSPEFLRACTIAPALSQFEGRGPTATWGRFRAGSRELNAYQRRLPVIEVRTTTSPTGRMIGEHLAIRENGRWRYRGAQGILEIPGEFAEYMRGRSRQAVRTNLGHARRAGLSAFSIAIDDWAPGADDSRSGHITPGPIERWMVTAADGEVVGDAILSVDEDVALLHGMVSFVEYGRWLMHTSIVERLCGSCEVLLTNSDDAYLMHPGQQHFQRLLGYRVSRLRVAPGNAARTQQAAPHPAGLAWPPRAMSWR